MLSRGVLTGGAAPQRGEEVLRVSSFDTFLEHIEKNTEKEKPGSPSSPSTPRGALRPPLVPTTGAPGRNRARPPTARSSEGAGNLRSLLLPGENGRESPTGAPGEPSLSTNTESENGSTARKGAGICPSLLLPERAGLPRTHPEGGTTADRVPALTPALSVHHAPRDTGVAAGSCGRARGTAPPMSNRLVRESPRGVVSACGPPPCPDRPRRRGRRSPPDPTEQRCAVPAPPGISAAEFRVRVPGWALVTAAGARRCREAG